MASFKNLISNTSAQISSGGTITGSLVVEGQLQVDGGGSLSFDEIVQGTSTITVTDNPAFLVEKADGTDVFIVDTTNSRVGIGGTPSDDLHIINSENVYIQLESSNTGTTKESAIKYSNFSTGSNFWWVGLNQSDDYSLAYGTSFSGANTRLLLTETGQLGVGTGSPEERIHSTGAIVSTGVNDTGATAGTERAFIDLVSNKARIGHFRGTTSAGSGGLQFYTDSVERANIDASGVLSLKSGRLRLSDNETDNTNKESHIISSQYDTDESEGYMAMRIASNSADNHVSIGGGHADVNASTLIRFFTASNKTTRTGTERMRIGSSGNISIGTTSSYGLLTVSGGTPALYLEESDADAGDKLWNIAVAGETFAMNCRNDANSSGNSFFAVERTDSSIDSIKLKTGAGTDALVIDSSQNVGIGTSSPKHYSGTSGTILSIHNSSFRGVLELSGASNSDGGVIGALTFANTENSSDNGALAQLYTEVQTSDSNDGNDSGGHLLFFTKPEAGTLTERMRIDSSGNVSIGNTPASYTDAISTSQTLSIGENQDSSDKLASVQIIGRGSGSTDTLGALEFINTRSGSGVVASIVGGRYNGGSVADGSLSFNTKNGSSFTTKMTISDTGSVGIGNSAPESLLHIESTQNATMRIHNTTAGYAPQLLFEGNVGANADHLLGKIDATWDGASNVVSSVRFESGADTSNKDDGLISFWTSSASSSVAERMRINQDGNVGIGASPQTGFTQNLTIEGASPALILRDSTSSNQATQFYTVYTANNAVKHYFDHDGSLNFASSTDYAGSGESIKFKLDANSRISLGNNDNSGATSNTIFGRLAGNAIASGAIDNVLIGNEAGNDVTTGDYLVAIGSFALEKEDVGRSSIAIGASALGRQNTVSEGSANTIGIGTNAGFYNVTGTENVHIGHNSGLGTDGQGGSNITAVGNEALKVAYGQDNVAIGKQAGLSVTSGVRNLLIGNNAGDAITTGNYVTAVGIFAGSAINDSGADGTTLLGYSAGLNITSGAGNTAVGYLSLQSVDDGSKCTAVGYQAGNTTEGATKSTFIGYDTEGSGANVNNETVIGSDAVGQGGNSVTLGNADVTDVYMAQDSGATVHGAGVRMGGDSTYTNEFKISATTHIARFRNDNANFDGLGVLIQVGKDAPNSAGDNTYLTFHSGDGDAHGGIRNSSTVANPEFFNGSDLRMKKDVSETNIKGLDTINAIPLKEWNWNTEKEMPKTNIGIVADDLEKVLPELVSENTPLDGWEHCVKDGEKPLKTIPTESQLTLILMKAVQELSAKVAELEKK